MMFLDPHPPSCSFLRVRDRLCLTHNVLFLPTPTPPRHALYAWPLSPSRATRANNKASGKVDRNRMEATVLSWLIPPGALFNFCHFGPKFLQYNNPPGGLFRKCHPMCFENKICIALNFVRLMETHPPTMCSDLCPAHTFAFDQEFSALLRKKPFAGWKKPYIINWPLRKIFDIIIPPSGIIPRMGLIGRGD